MDCGEKARFIFRHGGWIQGLLEVVAGSRKGQGCGLAVIGTDLFPHLERHQKYDHKIDQDRNGDANHIHGNLDDQVSFQVEHDYNGKEKVAIIGCES